MQRIKGTIGWVQQVFLLKVLGKELLTGRHVHNAMILMISDYLTFLGIALFSIQVTDPFVSLFPQSFDTSNARLNGEFHDASRCFM